MKPSLTEKTTPSCNLVLILIQEELKSRKFFNTLRELGLDNSYFQPHLDELILTYSGMKVDDDKTFDCYYEIIERHSEQITGDNDSIKKQALEAYNELILRRKDLN